MIRVAPQPEPADFDAQVRQLGLSALAELVGEPPPFWRQCLPQLAAAYRRICAYSCHYVEPITGLGTADHYVPKSLDARRAYEWANYRFACARMNARKGVAAEVLDPFEVQDGWFQLELVRFQLHAAPRLPIEVVASIDRTIDLLRLNDEACKQTRADWCEAYWAGHLGLPFLERRFPLLARELRRQDRLIASDRLR